MNILFCGDIMPGGVLPYQQEYISKAVQDYLNSFDLRVGTLEAAIGTGLSFDEVKMNGRANIIYARNEDFYRIKEMGFDIVSLANNHIFDLGVDGLENTIRILKENGIKYCGAGNNIKEASEPVIVEYNNKKIVFLAYSDYDIHTMAYVPIATEDSYGVNPFIIENVISDIKYYKKKCDYVFVMPHWGKEYSVYPLKKIKNFSKLMINAGADLILGSHTHIVQPDIKYKFKNIFYSVGNFLFPDFYMNYPRPIWYPEKDYDILSIEATFDYPYPVQKPLKRVWRNFSRIGLMVGVTIADELIVYKQLVVLQANNILDLYCNKRFDLKMHILGLLIKSPFYNEGILLDKIRALLYKIRKYIKK